MKLQIGMDSMLKLLREFINQTGFAVQSLVSLTGWEPISGSHFSSFLQILPLKQYNGWISMKSMKRQIIL